MCGGVRLYDELPERRHPTVEVFCAQTFDMKGRVVRVDVNVFPASCR